MKTLYGYAEENSGVGIYTRKLHEALGGELVEPPRILKPRAFNQMLLSGLSIRKIESEILHVTNQDDLGTIMFPDQEGLVVTVHDIFRHTDPDAPFDSWRSMKYLENLEKADKVIAISHFTKEQILEHSEVEEEKVEVVYQGVDLEEFQPGGEVEYSSYYLHVGSDLERKNQEGLIRIFSKLDEDAKLVKIGPLSEEAMELVEEHSLQEKVVVEKDVSFERLKALYSNAEKLVFPSHREGFGRPILESLACGTPVVAYDRKPMNEVLPESMLVEYGDEDAFAEKLSQEYEGETREIAEEYTWEKTAEKTREVYSRL